MFEEQLCHLQYVALNFLCYLIINQTCSHATSTFKHNFIIVQCSLRQRLGYKSICSKSNLSQTNLSQFWSVRTNFKSIRPTLVNSSQLKTICPKNVGQIDQILVNLSQLFFHYLQIWDELTKRWSICPNFFICYHHNPNLSHLSVPTSIATIL